MLFLLTGMFLVTADAAAKPMNVLFICVDDLKPVLGCYGDSIAKTPHLDALAASGLRLDRAFCNQAVCSPSRNALMTGLRPQTLGIYDLATNFRKSRPTAVTVAQHFQSHGYRTEALGKIFHVGQGNFEDAASWTVPHFRPSAKTYAKKENDAPKASQTNVNEPWKNPRGTATEAGDVSDESYADGQIALEAVNRIKAAKGQEKPFFLAIGFAKPHLPFIAPQKYWDLYKPSSLPMPQRNKAPDGAPSYAPQYGGELRNYRGIPGGNSPLDEKLTRHLIHGYYASMSYMDACAGKVLDAIKANGFADNTIIVLWGDHGWHLGDHGMWCKHTNYEQATRIPLMICVPGKKPAVSKSLVETVDVYPTLAALAGLPAPSGVDGKSFAALLDDAEAPHRDHAVHVYPRNQLLGRAIRTDRYRMVEWKKISSDPSTAEYELYDYEKDPNETKNLASSKPEVLNQLKAILANHPEAKPQVNVGPKSPHKPQAKDRVAMFRQRDRDKDGKLTREEFLHNQPDPKEAPKRFPTFDANGDGTLSEDEFVNSGKAAK